MSVTEQARTVPKPWGHELIWVQTPQYVGKILVIETGKRLSMQYHRKKDESVYVLSGKMRLHLEDDDGVVRTRDLAPGEFGRVKVGGQPRQDLIERVELMGVSLR